MEKIEMVEVETARGAPRTQFFKTCFTSLLCGDYTINFAI